MGMLFGLIGQMQFFAQMEKALSNLRDRSLSEKSGDQSNFFLEFPGSPAAFSSHPVLLTPTTRLALASSVPHYGPPLGLGPCFMRLELALALSRFHLEPENYYGG